MKDIVITLTDDDYRRLMQMAEVDNVSIGDLLEKIIKDYVDNRLVSDN